MACGKVCGQAGGVEGRAKLTIVEFKVETIGGAILFATMGSVAARGHWKLYGSGSKPSAF